MKTLNPLARTAPGRVLLHALFLLRHPEHLRWHWQGILREIPTASSAVKGRSTPVALVLGLCLLLNLTGQSLANYSTGWIPGSQLDWGQGFEPLDPREGKAVVARMRVPPISAPSPDVGTGLKLTFAQTAVDSRREMGIDMAMSVQAVLPEYGIEFGGGGALHFLNVRQDSARSLTFVFRYSRAFRDELCPASQWEPDPGFVALVEALKSRYGTGAPLHKKINELCGRYFVSGRRYRAETIVRYTFNFSSSRVVRDFLLTQNGHFEIPLLDDLSPISAEWESQFRQWFEGTESRATASFDFYSTDGAATNTLGIPLSGVIQTYDEFQTQIASLKEYCEGMTPENAAVREWLLQPLVNLPGYRVLTGYFDEFDPRDEGYGEWLRRYGDVKKWEIVLSYWLDDPARRLSWLNTNGLRLVVNTHRDLVTCLRGMEEKARRHFSTGERLEVTEDVRNCRQLVSQIPFPTINILGGGETCYYNVIGFVNCGSRDLASGFPFASVLKFRDGLPLDDAWGPASINYSPEDFEALIRRGFTSCQSLQQWALNIVNSPAWAQVRELAGTSRIGIFFAHFQPTEDRRRVTLGLEDASRKIVDSVSLQSAHFDLRAGFSPAAVEADLRIALADSAVTGAVDQSVRSTYAVTNLSLAATFGNVVTLPIPAGMEVLAVRGSQGFGTVTNSQVRYEIGPLGYGNAASIRLELVPIRTGIVPAATATVAAGDGLVDPNWTDNTVIAPPLTVTPPVLAITKGTGYVDLSWISETGRLVPQSAPRLAGLPIWTTLTNGITTVDGRKMLRLPATAASKFFRLVGTPG